ncbi:MAG: Sporulation initiation phosphotransferase F [Candidatus Omnitrophica bacterium ADurb.Bin205]|nr:MAG: Sporulation initiation phosphotransferase F [Candidatus Omnitrophica bacterium ADurb.Bin205]
MTKILIVEDEEKVRRMYNTMLKNEGFEVIEAPDAMQASCILNKEPVDIMLLDIKMPQVYGSIFYDMMQRSYKKVKVIVASVYPIDEQKKMIEGAADYYDKSQGLDLLLEKVKKAERAIKQQKSILVIDDEPRIRKIYRHYLEEYGYRIIEAHDGNAGLDILRKSNEIALVILDLAMPRQSGFEVYEQMKKEFPGIKILVASVFNQNDQQFFLPNADEYYDKSEDAAGLVKKIEKLIYTDSPA